MTKSLRELADARADLSCAFDRLWPSPDCPCAAPPPSLEELDALEQRYRWAQRTVEQRRQSAAAEAGPGETGWANAAFPKRME